MDKVTFYKKYNTDTFGSWDLTTHTLDIYTTFNNVLQFALDMQANLIIKPSRGKFWYIKKLKDNLNINNLEEHINNNQINNFKPNSTLWLIKYNL